jgi:Ser/Thr protein kinase RdoA (MazF antagonist)
MSAAAPAYADLTPDHLLDALDAVGLRGDGRVLQLNSYENRVYRLMLEDGDAVAAKFYRPGRWSDAQILEEHDFARELVEAEVPVVAPLVLRARGPGVTLLPADRPPTLALRSSAAGTHRYAVWPCHAGRTPELEDPAVLQRLGGLIGRLHAVGARRAFAHRRRLDPAADVRDALALLDAGGFVPEAQRDRWARVTAEAVARIDEAMAAGQAPAIRLHGDCHPGNLLWRDSGAHVVDLDDACMGPAVQDLWMLLDGDTATMTAQLRELLHGYAPFMDFDRRELRLIEPLRLLRMIRHNAWVAQRWHDPAFPRAFPDFGSAAYWAQQTLQLREQLSTSTEAPPLDTLR